MLLPFFEQNAVWDRIVANPGRTPWNGDNLTRAVTIDDNHFVVAIPGFMCPSESQRPAVGNPSQGSEGFTGTTNYRMNRGDMGTYQNDDAHAGRGVFVAGHRRVHSFGTIRDGTANTVALAEGVIGTKANEANVMGGQATRRNCMPGNRPSDWLLAMGSNNQFATGQTYYQRTIGGTGGGYAQYLGRNWGDGAAVYSGIFTILPPNSVSVVHNDTPENDAVACASSFHPGGAGTILCDASYRFVTNSVDTSTGGGLTMSFADVQATNPSQYTGLSPYGVWGAMGTPDCDESRAMP